MKASGLGRFVRWGSRAEHPPLDQDPRGHPECFSPRARCARWVVEVSLRGGKQVPLFGTVCCFSSDLLGQSSDTERLLEPPLPPRVKTSLLNQNMRQWVAVVRLRLLCASVCAWRHFFLGRPRYFRRAVMTCLCYSNCCPN